MNNFGIILSFKSCSEIFLKYFMLYRTFHRCLILNMNLNFRSIPQFSIWPNASIIFAYPTCWTVDARKLLDPKYSASMHLFFISVPLEFSVLLLPIIKHTCFILSSKKIYWFSFRKQTYITCGLAVNLSLILSLWQLTDVTMASPRTRRVLSELKPKDENNVSLIESQMKRISSAFSLVFIKIRY